MRECIMQGTPRKLCGSVSIFTLIELLIVIAIIAILAAMLLPALGAARATARQVACVNKSKQMATALLSYTGDCGDYLPYDYTGTDNHRPWEQTFAPWYADRWKSPMMFHCVEYEEAKADTSQIGDKSIPTIQLNYHLSGTTVFNDSPVKISRCPLPSRGALLMEKNWRGKFDTPILIGSNMNRHGIHIQFHPWYNAQYGIYRHKRKNAVIAHVDGHVDATPEPISRTLHGANRYDLYYLLSAGLKDLPYLSYDW